MQSLCFRIAGALFVFFWTVCAYPQVPQLITYQGRVSSGGTAFSGTGQFKFALIDIPGGATNFVWRNDGVVAPGEPAAFASVPVTNGLFTVVLGDATLPGMAPIPPGVFFGTAIYLRIWFNDGVNGFAQLTPDQRITAVAYAIVADNVRDGAITASKIAAGAIDATRLAQGAAVSNLMASGQSGVGIGGVILSPQADNPNLAAAGYVRIGQTDLISESWLPRTNGPPPTFTTPVKRSGHTAIWTGTEMIVWGGTSEAGLENTGGRYNPALNTWSSTSITNAPTKRSNHTAVWTGTEMIIFGGATPAFSLFTSTIISTNTGARYNPASDTWTTITPAPGGRRNHAAVYDGTYMTVWGGTFTGTGSFGQREFAAGDGSRYHMGSNAWFTVSAVNAPAARQEFSAVWTGTEMVIWGGFVEGGSFITTRSNLNTGARYNPATDTWVPTTTSGAPLGKYGHSAVWTGTQMIVWGGFEGDSLTFSNVLTGARYNLPANTWTTMTTVGAPEARAGHSAVWDGTRMLIWGGVSDTTYFGNGTRYFPANNTWSNITTAGAPTGRTGHRAVWTGNQMIVWGGGDGHVLFDLGGKYNPTNDSWLPTAPTGQSVRRSDHTAIWTGTEMIVWGGFDGEVYLNNGGRFNPALNSWTPLTLTGAPEPRALHTAVWSGSQMIVWGGYNGSVINTGGRYNPAANSWAATTATGAPTPRSGHSAVWADTVMIIWGGENTAFLNSGARYSPAANNWTTTTATAAPAIRSRHSAVWTGDEMIVWGGSGGTPASPTALATGARYRLASNSWTALPTAGAPPASSAQTAVWTGHEMLVWGGLNTNYLNSGGRYLVASNTWSVFTTNNAPSPRAGHTAVWDGSHMIVWGGLNESNYLGSGGLYDPFADLWSPTLMNTNTPSARAFHAAVWTGNEMVVHGGFDGFDYFDTTYSYVPPRRMFLYLKP